MVIRPGFTVSDTFRAELAMRDASAPMPALDLYTVYEINYADEAGIGVKTTSGGFKTILLNRPQDYIVWDEDGNLVSI